jgi:Rap1a immunity proteins
MIRYLRRIAWVILTVIDEITEFTNLVKGESKRSYCRPESASTGKLIRLVYKYLENHPEELDQKASYLTLTALKNAFPYK